MERGARSGHLHSAICEMYVLLLGSIVLCPYLSICNIALCLYLSIQNTGEV